MADNLWPNADIESGITDWTADGGASIAHSSTQAWEETYSLGVSWVTGNYDGALSDIKSIVEASTQYTFSFYCYIEDAGVDLRVVIRDQESNLLAATTNSGATSGSWVRYDETFTTGAGATGLSVLIRQQATAVDTTFYVDGVQLETGASATAWENYATGVEVTPTLGTLTAAGSDPNVGSDALVLPNVGGVDIAGYNPITGTPVVVIVGNLGTAEIAGLDPGVGMETGVDSGAGAVVEQGYDPVVLAPVGVYPGVGAAEIAGYDAVVNAGTGAFSSLGRLDVDGHDPVVNAATGATNTLGAAAITGLTPVVGAGAAWEVGAYIYSPLGGVTINADAGTVTVTGYNPSTLTPVGVTQTPTGTLLVAGSTHVVTVGTDVVSTLGTMEVAGSDPFVSSVVAVSPGLGTATVTGYDPAATLVPVGVDSGRGILTIAGRNPTVAAIGGVPAPDRSSGSTMLLLLS